LNRHLLPLKVIILALSSYKRLSDVLPPPKVIEKGDQTIKIFFKWRENETTNKKELVKVTRTFVQERVKTSKRVAERKTWKKFGLAADDGPGKQKTRDAQITDLTLQDHRKLRQCTEKK
jgi:hypothetical protein